MAYRFATVIALLVSAYAFLLFHLCQLQLVKGGYYLAKADSETAASADAAANRGTIYFTDKDGKTLPAALDQNFPTIWASPKDVTDPVAAATTLAPILNMSVTTLEGLFKQPNSTYAGLVKKADAATEQAVNNANIPGVYTDLIPQRFYPLGSVGAQVLGYVGPNTSNNGQSGHYGVEGFYNSVLNGTASSTDGVAADVDLTIDPNLQAEAEKVLDALVAANNASGGSVIIEDPTTGKILAMGATPSFDPNNYGSSPIANFLNTSVQAVYEPGSIFKVLTMAAGIDAGKITPNTTYDDKGYVNVGKAHITNYNLTTYGAYGPGTTMTEVIEHSINTGAIFAENQTGNSTFTEYMKKFHLDQPTGIDLPGEVAGDLSQLNPKSPQVDFDTAAYGQGVAVTPIELVQAVASIANGGIIMRPYVNAALQPESVGRSVSASTAAQVTAMMTAAVDDVAGAPAINDYSIAGKTGSAYIPNPAGGGYLNELTDSYIGFGPTPDPKFIAFIRLNTLPVTSLAAESVVPAFKELAQYIINYYNIPPDRVTQSQ
jgi:cell division protein FtsI/penicillin-binding protein 2